MNITKSIVDEKEIQSALKRNAKPTKKRAKSVLEKARGMKGLELDEVAVLINSTDPAILEEIFETAGQIKKSIYGERLVLFAPLYVSSFCINDCDYCGFHRRNPAKRKRLNTGEIEKEVKTLIDMGHKRLLVEFGEHPELNHIDYVVETIDTIYKTKTPKGEIRRVNVNIAATSVEDYRKLKEVGIGTYQLFQETYHKGTYGRVHDGPKADYERQLLAHDRAFEAGIDDVGLGVLFGLYDWRFEVLALISHAKYLDERFGVGPHTFSVPRIQPAETVTMETPYKVSDDDFLKTIAILRLAVPYTGMIISTRETPEIRTKAFEIGISQTSSGSATAPGGYSCSENLGQFEIGDHRGVDEFLGDILEQGLLPSFCTACYRQGRTGEKFMDLAKPGDIQNFCRPNAVLTFKEYLEDHASEKVKKQGLKIISKYLEKIPSKTIKTETEKKLKEIEKGGRDIYF